MLALALGLTQTGSKCGPGLGPGVRGGLLSEGRGQLVAVPVCWRRVRYGPVLREARATCRRDPARPRSKQTVTITLLALGRQLIMSSAGALGGGSLSKGGLVGWTPP